jgi:tRNA(fMet)-specific endonuclease VapC
MLRYMLDTDTCSSIMKRSHPAVLQKLEEVPVGDVCISVITKSELLHGIEISPRRQQDQAALNSFLRYVEVLDFSDEAALQYAKVRSELKSAGTMIGANDLFIAAHARTLGLTLVINNMREFGRVPNLVTENWTA